MSEMDEFGFPTMQPPLPGNTTGVPTDETGSTTAPDNQTPNANGGDPNAPPVTPPPPAPPTPPEQNRANITNPTLPNGAQVNPVLQTADPSLVTDPNKFQQTPVTPVTTATAPAATQAKPAEKPEVERVEASTISGATPQATAEQGAISQGAVVQAEQQQGLSSELKGALDTFNAELNAVGVDPNMTVQGQYTKLMQGFDNGGVPTWASGAIKVANQRLAARGLSASTMAGEAVSSAVMQAAMPIAAQDAQVFKDLKLAVLDKKAQGAFLRAGFIAQLDTANLNNRQQAAVMNAQSFLAMDMKNLDNRQQTAIVNTQARLQALMSDQAAINSARQFNAASTNQVNQFYAGLSAETDRFNTSQVNAMRQFNAGETNAMSRFNSEQDARRTEFNTRNAVIIDQANTQYLRGISTQNNAMINQANMVNSQNLVNISNTAMANEIQLWRDGASYIFQAHENELDRTTQLAINTMQNQEWFRRYNTQQKDSFWSGIGNFLLGAAGNVLEDYLDGGLDDN